LDPSIKTGARELVKQRTSVTVDPNHKAVHVECKPIQDVTILGGGLAGLSLGLQLLRQRPACQVLILEKSKDAAPEAAFKVGESSVEIGAHYLAEELGLKKHLLEHHLPKFGLRFFFGNGTASLEQAFEVGPSDFFATPGYQIDRGRLENHMAQCFRDAGGRILEGAAVRELTVEPGPTDSHVVEYERDGERSQLTTRWLVDASGRAGLLKRKLGLREEVNHRISAAWFRIGAEIRVDEWSDCPDWRARAGKVPRRWLSTNHLLGRGYWVWIIPLGSGATSIGIVADPNLHPLSEYNSLEKAFAWLERFEPVAAAALRAHEDKVMDFLAIKQIAYGCGQVYSADRWAVTGEAGVFLDPLYSPGLDYIAMANTQICGLIGADLDGGSLRQLLPQYQGIFLSLFHDNLRTYQDQYPLFGNPKVMSLKYVWDYCVYWGFPALLYFHGKITDAAFFARIAPGIGTIRDLNRRMQEYFRDWDAADPGIPRSAAYINQNGIPLLMQLNRELRERLDDTALQERFIRNVGILGDLANEMTARVTTGDRSANSGRLTGLFAALGV